jgi:leucyl aminopeptidase
MLEGGHADWLVVPTFASNEQQSFSFLDGALQSRLTAIVDRGDFTGKVGEVLPVFLDSSSPTPRVLLVGLGAANNADRGTLRQCGEAAAHRLSAKACKVVDWLLPVPVARATGEDLLLGLIVGFYVGCHSPALLKSEPERFAPEVVRLSWSHAEPLAATAELMEEVLALSRGINLARDLVNLPPSELYPESFATRCRELAREYGLGCDIMDEERLKSEQMGCVLGVGQGSSRPPRVVVLTLGQGDPQLAFVGKGVTFDSGGLSLKTTEQMVEMKSDMAGAAAVVGAMTVLTALRCPVPILGLVALVENMPGPAALKLGDVLRSRSGKTIEILNTDAEGRLILADVLVYAVSKGVSHIVDLATLTGACMVALGKEIAGLFSNHDGWADQVRQAADRAGERVWRLPLPADYTDQLKSQVADCKNVGGKFGGAITAALFLQQFVGTTPWVHLDIAGPAFNSEKSTGRDAGGTGFGVATLVELAKRYAN